MKNYLPHIVIVGGGAGGLELATRLGKKLGRSKQAKITLLDENATHLWKPLLHEVAAGTLDANQDELNYFIHASINYYHFQLGRMSGLNRRAKEIIIAPLKDETGKEIIPSRSLSYDVLVLSFGSITNDFGIPGVQQHCLFLDDRHQADRFQQLFLKYLLQLQSKTDDNKKMDIVIVGAGATGVELAAELHYTVLQAVTYGLDHINPEKDVKITLVEAADRILPLLPKRISLLATKELQRRNINVLTNEKVTSVTPNTITTASNRIIPATIIVWAVGVKVAEFRDKLDGLELNARNQIVVKQTLQTSVDPNIFAFGDCSACPQLDDQRTVPPRAQAANQEAALLAKSLPRYLKKQSLLPFIYKDYGSLISLSHSHTLGTLMGKLMGNILLEGKIARLIYLSLYKKHQMILHGCSWVYLKTFSNILTRRTKPRLKLH